MLNQLFSNVDYCLFGEIIEIWIFTVFVQYFFLQKTINYHHLHKYMHALSCLSQPKPCFEVA